MDDGVDVGLFEGVDRLLGDGQVVVCVRHDAEFHVPGFAAGALKVRALDPGRVGRV